jgi:enoyl-CoA hydratase/carnithine racemase
MLTNFEDYCEKYESACMNVGTDAPHFWNGLAPGDGVATAWLHAYGPNRGHYFQLGGRQLDAQEAFDLGVVKEIVPSDQLPDQAWEFAREIVKADCAHDPVHQCGAGGRSAAPPGGPALHPGAVGGGVPGPGA